MFERIKKVLSIIETSKNCYDEDFDFIDQQISSAIVDLINCKYLYFLDSLKQKLTYMSFDVSFNYFSCFIIREISEYLDVDIHVNDFFIDVHKNKEVVSTPCLVDAISIPNPVLNKKKEVPLFSCDASGKILFIKLSSFTFDKAEYHKDSTSYNYEKIVIDLSDNMGGSVPNMLNVFSYFLSSNQILFDMVNTESKIHVKGIEGNQIFFANDVYVKINRRTASSAELFALLLKVYANAHIFGEKSYGKGIVQSSCMIGEEKLIFPKYKIFINGVTYDKIGIIPDDSIFEL